MYLSGHSHGIAESHILLASHLFHKLHNLGEQRQYFTSAAASLTNDTTPSFIFVGLTEARHSTYIVKLLCLI